jgi:hypothetical protein
MSPVSADDPDSIFSVADRSLIGIDGAILTRKRAQLIRETIAASHPATPNSNISSGEIENRQSPFMRFRATNAKFRTIHRNMWECQSSSESEEESASEDDDDDSFGSRTRSPFATPPRGSLASSTSSATSSATSSPVRDWPSRTVSPQSSSQPRSEMHDVSIVSLGYVIPRPPYVGMNHIWPVGFYSRRAMYSMRFRGQLTIYDCWISDSALGPVFNAIARDDLVR